MPALTRSHSSSSAHPERAFHGSAPARVFIFLAGLSAGIAIVLVVTSPILAKGLEAHHHLPPSRRRRRRMILGYCGMAVGALCFAVYALTFGTPLYASLLRP